MTWALLLLAVLIVAALEVVLRRRAGRAVTPRDHVGAGDAALEAGDHEAAMRHYRRALELHPKHQKARWSLAAVYHELGRTAEAREVCPDYRPPMA